MSAKCCSDTVAPTVVCIRRQRVLLLQHSTADWEPRNPEDAGAMLNVWAMGVEWLWPATRVDALTEASDAASAAARREPRNPEDAIEATDGGR